MVQIHPGVAADFEVYLKSIRAGRQWYDTNNSGQLQRCCDPLPVGKDLIKRWKRRRDELWRTHRWNTSRSCFVLGTKEVILQQDILRTIVDHWLPENLDYRRLHQKISRQYVGVSREDCKKTLELARKHGWYPPPNPRPEVSACSTSPTLPLISGVQFDDSERAHIKELNRWSKAYLEYSERDVRRYQTIQELRDHVQTASEHIPTSLSEPDQGASIINVPEEDIRRKMNDPHYQLPLPPIVVRNGPKDDLLNEKEFCRRLLQRPDDRIECQNTQGRALERYQTLMISPAEAIERFKNEDRDSPINMLSLRGRPDRIWWIKAIYENCVLTEFRNDYNPNLANHHPGKPAVVQRDLSNCDSFMAAGGKYSASDKHADQHGMITGVRCESGLKLWLYWAPLSSSDLEEVARNRFDWNSHPHYITFLRPGEYIVMRPLLFHAPLSVEKTILSGIQFWRKSMVRAHMEAVVWQHHNPDWSNEFQAKELIPEVYRIARAVDAELEDPDIWGPEEDRITFFRLAMVSCARFIPAKTLTRTRVLSMRSRCATAGRRTRLVLKGAVLVL
jgi:hypothetical protein